MNMFSRPMRVEDVDRRATQRVTIDCAARLLLPSGRREGRLVNLSLEGGQFTTDQAPPQGCWAMLEWQDLSGDWQESYCQVQWVREEACGLRFERSITREQIEASGHVEVVQTRASADASRIQLGQKRARLF